MATLYSYTPYNEALDDPINTASSKGQVFTLSSGGTVESVTLRVRRVNNATNCRVSLYSTSGGLPLAELAYVDVDPSGWSTGYNDLVFTFDTPYEAEAETYCIVLSSTDAPFDNPSWAVSTDNNGTEAVWTVGGVWEVFVGPRGHSLTVSGTEAGHVKASNPTPANGATEVDFSGYTLSWDGNGDTYDVRGGAAGNFVLLASGISDKTYTLDSSEVPLFKEGVVTWRVDSTKDTETLTGDEWTFDPRPGKASSPTPSDEGTDISIEQDFSWTIGTNGTTNDLVLAGSTILSGSTDTSYSLAADLFDWEDSVEWRVDSINEFGTTTGDTWGFTAKDLDHLRITYNLIDGGSGNGPYDDPAGVEGVDYFWTGLNNVITVKRLVMFGKDRCYFENFTGG